MTIDLTSFPLDLTGENPRNRVTGDTRTFSNSIEMQFMPDGGPFFTDSLIVRSGTRVLRPIVDYKCFHMLREATQESGLEVSTIVQILDTSISTVVMDYQVIGGPYANVVPAIRQALENSDTIGPGVDWNAQVFAKPDVFPPAPHFVRGEDFSSWHEVLLSMDNINRAIAYKAGGSWNAVYTYMDRLIDTKFANRADEARYSNDDIDAMVADLAPKSQYYTKRDSNNLFFTKDQVRGLIGNIDGNEEYYTKPEVNSKFIDRVEGDAKYATTADYARLDDLKIDKTQVYTRQQIDNTYATINTTYTRARTDELFASKNSSYTKAVTDSRYAKKADSYTKPQADSRFALKEQLPKALDLSIYATTAQVADTYLKSSIASMTYLRKTTADATYAPVALVGALSELGEHVSETYYTSETVDDTFLNKTDAKGTYLSKENAERTYATKTWVQHDYATRAMLSQATTLIDNYFKKYSQTTAIEATYAKKTDVDETYISKVDANNRYHTKTYIDNAFLTKTTFTSKLRTLATVNALNDAIEDINNRMGLLSPASDVSARFYTKTQSDAKFANKNNTISRLDTIDDTLKDKLSLVAAEHKYLTKKSAEALYFTKTQIYARCYTRDYLDEHFLRKEDAVDGSNGLEEAKEYTDEQVDWLKGHLKTYMTNADANRKYYTMETIDDRFLTISNFRKLEANLEVRFHDMASTNTLKSYVSLSWANDYLLTKNDAETFYLRKDDATTTYVTQESWNEKNKTLNQHIGDKVSYEWLRASYSTNAKLNEQYYPRAVIDQDFVTKVDADKTYNTKATFDAFTARAALKSDVDALERLIDAGATSGGGNASLDYIRDTYQKKSDMNRYLTTLNADSLYLRSNIADLLLLSKKEASELYMSKLDAGETETSVKRRLTELENRYGIKIGDLFLTTKDFSNSTQVASHLGYGTWQRHAQGRAIVGQSSNEWADGQVREDKYRSQYFNTSIDTVGRVFGRYHHTLSVAELPTHKHSNGDYNYFVSKATTATNAKVAKYAEEGTSRGSKIPVAGFGTNDWNNMEERSTGNSKPHGNIQPSIVIGVWKRVA